MPLRLAHRPSAMNDISTCALLIVEFVGLSLLLLLRTAAVAVAARIRRPPLPGPRRVLKLLKWWRFFLLLLR